MTQKSVDAFRTIGEVSEDLSLPQHVLRFWETKFAQIRPMKRGGGRRYYKPDDVDLLRGIQYLLYVRGMTIKGVQRILKGQGPRFVVAVGKGDTTLLDELQADLQNPSRPGDGEANEGPQGGERTPAPAPEPSPDRGRGEAGHPEHGGMQAEAVAGERRPMAQDDEPTRPDAHRPDHKSDHRPMSFPSFLKRGRDHEAVRSFPAGLSSAQTEALEAVVLELLECKRILDQVR